MFDMSRKNSSVGSFNTNPNPMNSQNSQGTVFKNNFTQPSNQGGQSLNKNLQPNIQQANNLQSNSQGTNNKQSNIQGTNNLQPNLQGTNNLQSKVQGASNFNSNLQGTNNLQPNLQGIDRSNIQKKVQKNDKNKVDVNIFLQIHSCLKEKKKLSEQHVNALELNFGHIISHSRKDSNEMGQLFEHLGPLLQNGIQPNGPTQAYEIFHMQLWKDVIQFFLKSYQFCSMSFATSILNTHIHQNASLYLWNGKFSQYFFTNYSSELTNPDKTTSQKSSSINYNSELFMNIIGELQKLTVYYCQYIYEIFRNIPNQLFDSFTKKQNSILDNLTRSFRTIMGYERRTIRQTRISPNKSSQTSQLRMFILRSISNLFHREKIILMDIDLQKNQNSQIFTLERIINLLNIYDASFDELDKIEQDQIIQILNIMLFNGSLAFQKWSQDKDKVLTRAIMGTKCFHFAPFRWLVNIISITKQDDRYFRINQYHKVYGKQWLQVTKKLIGEFKRRKNLQTNYDFQQMLFCLVCSIIEDDPLQFWENTTDYEFIYGYIRFFAEAIFELKKQYGQLQYQDQDTQELIGKFIRFMICSCSKSAISSEETEYMFNKFAEFILADQNYDHTLLFNELILPYVLSDELNYISQMQIPQNQRYSCRLPNCAHELLLKIGIDKPALIQKLYIIYINDDNDYGQQNRIQLTLQDFIYMISFKYLQIISKTRENQGQDRKAQQFSQFTKFISSLLSQKFVTGSDKQIRNACCNILTTIVRNNQNDGIIDYSQIRSVLSKLISSQAMLACFSEHIINFYQNDLGHLQWICKLCLPLIHQLLSKQQQLPMFKYYSDILVVIIKSSFGKQNQILFNNLKAKQLDVQQVKNNKMKLTNIQNQIKNFYRNDDKLLKYVKWSLRIQEHPWIYKNYFNALFKIQEYGQVSSALSLLQTLFDLYQRFQDKNYVPLKFQKFFQIFTGRKKQQSLFDNQNTLKDQNNRFTNIHISQDTIVTFPGAIGYLILSYNSEPVYLPTKKQKNEDSSTKIKLLRIKTIKSALNILSLILLNYKKFDYEVDFTVYKAFFINDFIKVYCTCREKLTIHLQNLLKDQSQLQLYGEIFDLLMLLMDQYSPQKTLTLMNIVDCRIIMSRITSPMKTKQLLAYSRFILHLISQKYIKTNKLDAENLQKLWQITKNVLLFMAEKISFILTEIGRHIMLPESQSTIDAYVHLQTLTINFCKFLRLFQLKQQSRKQFALLIHNYLPAVLDSKLVIFNCKKMEQFNKLQQGKNQNQSEKIMTEQYFSCLQIILCCRTYLGSQDYRIILKSNQISRALESFIEAIKEHHELYMLFIYSLEMYADFERQNFHREDTKKYHETSKQGLTEGLTSVTLKSHYNSNQKICFASLMMTINNLSDKWKIMVQEYSQKVVCSWKNKSVRDKISQGFYSLQEQIIEQSLFLNVITQPTLQTIISAIQMGKNSTHPLTYISVANHLYRAAFRLPIYQKQKINHEDIYTISISIVSFAEKVLKINTKKGDHQANLYMKAWACNILNAMLATSSTESIKFKISDIIINSNLITEPLGESLLGFAKAAKGSQFNIKKKSLNQLGLLEKQFLFSILKLVSTFFSDSILVNTFTKQQRNNKSSFWQNQSSKNKYNLFCQAIVQSSSILNSYSANRPEIRNIESQIHQYNHTPKNSYQYSLADISISTLIQQTLRDKGNLLQKINVEVMENFMHLNQGQSDEKLVNCIETNLFPNTPNCLDLIHEHFNTLISERFTIILLFCYENKSIGTFRFSDFLIAMERTLQKLYSISKLENTYNSILETSNIKIWKSINMSDELYYLNNLQEPLKDHVQLLNDLLEIMVSCCNKMVIEMELHKDFRQFKTKASKIIKFMRKHETIFNPSIGKYIEDAKFIDRSQYGQSFVAASAYLN